MVCSWRVFVVLLAVTCHHLVAAVPRALLEASSADLLTAGYAGRAGPAERKLLQAPTGLRLLAFGNDDHHQAEPPAAAWEGVVDAAGGIYHAVALLQDGSLISWGDDEQGQVSGQPSAEAVSAGGGGQAVAAGGAHSLVLLNNGTVLAWGDDSFEQTTVPPAARAGVKAIACGSTHSMALLENGTLIGWGETTASRLPPSVANRSDITAISSRTRMSMALTADGEILVWGDTIYQFESAVIDLESMMPPGAQPAAMIAAGALHLLAVGRDGKLYFWGITVEGDVAPPPEGDLHRNNRTAVAIAAGFRHSLILFSDGELVAFGDNEYGQVSVPAAAQAGATKLAAGSMASYVLGPTLVLPPVAAPPPPDTTFLPPEEITTGKNLDAVFWFASQAYNGVSDQPELVIEDVASITASKYLAFLTVHGDGGMEVISSEGFSFVNSDLPRDPVGNSVAAGEEFFLLLFNNGTLKWYDTVFREVKLPNLIEENQVVAMAAGAYHGLALLDTGRVVAFGDRDETNNKTVVPPEAEDGVTDVAAGNRFSLALKDGNVISWGVINTTVPIPAIATSGGNIKAIASSGSHALALTNQGGVVAWGTNVMGETTVPEAASSGVVQIGAGIGYSMALKESGEVVFWGWGSENATYVAPSFIKSGVQTIIASRYLPFALKTREAVAAPAPPSSAPAPPTPSLVQVPAGPPGFVVENPGTGGVAGDQGDLQSSSSTSSGSSSLSPGAIAGIVIGSVAGVALLVGGTLYFVRRRKMAGFEAM